MSRSPGALYVVLDPRALCAGAALRDVARAALDGGASVLQLRDKEREAGALVEEARALTALCEAYGARMVVNDRLDVALASGAHGVHLGPHDVSIADARAIADAACAGTGRRLWIGGSAGSPERAVSLVAQGADYLGVGAVFDARASKADASAPRGVEVIARVRAAVGDEVPLFGIGGVTIENAASVVAAGASGVAVIRAVVGQHDPQRAARALLGAMRRADAIG